MFRDVSLILGRVKEPATRALSISNGLLSGKGLAGDNEERSLMVTLAKRLSDMCSVNVGHEMRFEIALGVCLQRLSDHDGAQIRSADPNVDDSVDSLPGVSLPLAAPNGVGELFYVIEDAADFVYASFGDVEVVKVAQSDVQDGAVLRGVDVLAREHLIAVLFHFGFADQSEKFVKDRLRDEVFGEIEEEGDIGTAGRRIFPGKLGKSLRILGEELLEHDLGMIGVIDALEVLPGRVFCCAVRACSPCSMRCTYLKPISHSLFRGM